jgi:tetratricopeptide (TPR) repeat protein
MQTSKNKQVMRKLSLISVFLLIVCVAFAQSTNFNEGKKALESNDLDGALSYFNKDLVDNPTSALTFYYRAWVYYINSEYAKALNDITAGLKYVSSKQNKLKGGFYEMRAKVYNQLDEPDKAMADYNLAIKTDAEDPDFYNGRAQLFFEKNMYANADKDYLSMLKLDETDADALTGLSRNLLAQGKHEEADKMLLKLKKLHPEYANAYYYSAINKFEQQKYNDAISESFLAFCLDDDDDSNRELFLRYAAKNYDFALSKLNIKTKEEPENYYWYFYKGLLLQNNEKYGDAIISYNRTLSLMEEPNIKVMEHRANCYSELGLQELAIKDFDYILSKDSTRSYVYAYSVSSPKNSQI